MNFPEFDDRLELLGLLAGAFVVLAGIGMLSGMPWSTAESSAAGAVQVLGIVATIAVGVVIVLVARGAEIDELLPTG